MQRFCSLAFAPVILVAGAFSFPLSAAPLDPQPERFAGAPQMRESSAFPARQSSARRGHMGGGFIEFLFGGASEAAPRDQGPIYAPGYADPRRFPRYEVQQGAERPRLAALGRGEVDPKYERQVVDYYGPEKPGTIVIDTPNRFLYLIQENGKALRYGIGVGRPGFAWSGVKTVTMKREWPDWRPPDEMLKRRPDLPRYMPGGPDNPLGARALYLGSSLYRIHGSNEPWTIGQAVSSGCIRMRNEDVIDLYERVSVGTRVVVI